MISEFSVCILPRELPFYSSHGHVAYTLPGSDLDFQRDPMRSSSIVALARDDGRAPFTAHCSFVDPATPADAPPRESIEERTLAFFGSH